MKFRILVVLMSLLGIGCSDTNEISTEVTEVTEETISGSGVFEYSDYEPFNGKIIRVFYHVPSSATFTSKVLFIFHGNGRNAENYRDAMITKANQYNAIIIAPEFSVSNFPGGDSYNLGNIFIDGDNPSPSTLNPEDEWTFSVIEPLFDYIKEKTNNTSLNYSIFGHSAGGQFAHRFLMYKPNARYNTVLASASGWYTAVDFNTSFPYGFQNSPLDAIDLETLFEKKLIIQIGSLDNDPNASGLRRNEVVDLQGTNRLSRAQYFFDTSSILANENNLQFEWELHIVENLTHDFEVASERAADIIFN